MISAAASCAEVVPMSIVRLSRPGIAVKQSYSWGVRLAARPGSTRRSRSSRGGSGRELRPVRAQAPSVAEGDLAADLALLVLRGMDVHVGATVRHQRPDVICDGVSGSPHRRLAGGRPAERNERDA